ncbi:MAG TPA: hypothetical protein VGB98_07370 [Pyrinomonadaceae bacterium]|jgi:hypothetical protein
MRVFAAPLLLACALAPAAAQTPNTPPPAQEGGPGLAVVKHSWSKERINWEADPFGGPNENFDQMRARARNERRVLEARSGGNQIEAGKAEREARADSANIERLRAAKPARYGFLYKFTLRNDGARPVKAVEWDYVFTDAATGQELGRRRFAGGEKIGPGKKKEFAFFIPAPPTRTISADALDRKERVGLAEEVVVIGVLYEDGTVWRPEQEGQRRQ